MSTIADQIADAVYTLESGVHVLFVEPRIELHAHPVFARAPIEACYISTATVPMLTVGNAWTVVTPADVAGLRARGVRIEAHRAGDETIN